MIFTEQYFSDEQLNLTNDCFKLRLANTVIRTSIITSKLGEIILPVLYVTIMIVTITQMFGSTSGFCSDDFRYSVACIVPPSRKLDMELHYTEELTIESFLTECYKTKANVKSKANQIKGKLL